MNYGIRQKNGTEQQKKRNYLASCLKKLKNFLNNFGSN
jgi:hypothetical protein